MEADQLMTLTANKYKNMMIQNQWEAPSPHETSIQALESKVEKLIQQELKRAPKVKQHKNPQKKKRDKVPNHNAPNCCPTMRNPIRGNFPASGCGTETNGIGVPKKLEVNVRDAGSVTLPQVAKGRHSKVATRKGHLRMHLNKRNLIGRVRGRKKPLMEKKGSAINLPPLLPLPTMRQTIPVIMRNEDGGGKNTGQPTYLS